VKRKSGPFVTWAFRFIFDDDPKNSRRPVFIRTDKDKEFLKKYFQNMLRDEGYTFRCAKTPTWNVHSCNVRISHFVIDYTNILFIKIPSDISTFSQNLSGPTMTRFTRRPAWRSRVWQIRTSLLYGRRWRLRDAHAFAWLKSSLASGNSAYQ